MPNPWLRINSWEVSQDNVRRAARLTLAFAPERKLLKLVPKRAEFVGYGAGCCYWEKTAPKV
jgi:hypothetical protein